MQSWAKYCAYSFVFCYLTLFSCTKVNVRLFIFALFFGIARIVGWMAFRPKLIYWLPCLDTPYFGLLGAFCWIFSNYKHFGNCTAFTIFITKKRNLLFFGRLGLGRLWFMFSWLSAGDVAVIKVDTPLAPTDDVARYLQATVWIWTAALLDTSNAFWIRYLWVTVWIRKCCFTG